ncbi:unnamed protein product [Albugo candida]|uniref:Uncharacterized protein n=1 Tax=Albugo candida TaxID=65357 RepID=A0A024FXL7_9STRA|nr:unnamed protein product [Albugo candida]|eukprot:CCI11399.1 unnamed protein product [Albugo candida]
MDWSDIRLELTQQFSHARSAGFQVEKVVLGFNLFGLTETYSSRYCVLDTLGHSQVEPVTYPFEVQKAWKVQRSEMREDLEVGGLNVAVTIEKVCLVENDADFRKTSDKHRTSEHAADDCIQMPKDRTAALSSHTTPEHTPGRLIFEELRVLLKLHHENKATWTAPRRSTESDSFVVERGVPAWRMVPSIISATRQIYSETTTANCVIQHLIDFFTIFEEK